VREKTITVVFVVDHNILKQHVCSQDLLVTITPCRPRMPLVPWMAFKLVWSD